MKIGQYVHDPLGNKGKVIALDIKGRCYVRFTSPGVIPDAEWFDPADLIKRLAGLDDPS